MAIDNFQRTRQSVVSSVCCRAHHGWARKIFHSEGSQKAQTIELEGLECVLSHVTRNDYGKSKWYQHVGKKTARSHSGECFVAVFLAFSKCFHKFRAFISEIV